MILPSALAEKVKGANSRAKIAIIGWVGQGKASAHSLFWSKHADIVALCDVDENRAVASYNRKNANDAKIFDSISQLPKFKDYRVMLDKMDSSIDGVCVCTPDHSHYPISAWAIAKKKHVFCEKPLTRTIWESRELRRLASEAGVLTQMGNQVHTNDAWRTIREWGKAGVIGDIEDIYAWTDRAYGFDEMPHPTAKPASLDYNLWLNVAQADKYMRSLYSYRKEFLPSAIS